MSDEIFDEPWPAATPRDEMYERVTARGARLRATRRAVSSLLMVGSLLGAGAIGAGAISTLGGRTTEREIPEVAGPPDLDARGTPPSGPADPIIGSTSEPGTTDPSTTAPGTTAPGTTAPGSSTTAVSPPSTRGTTSTTAPPTVTTSPPATAPTTTTTTTEAEGGAPAPEVGVPRASVQRLYSAGTSGCAGVDTAATVTVVVRNATDVVLSWNDGSGTRSVAMTSDADGVTWSGQVGPIPNLPRNGSLPVTVKAHGPGGSRESASTITVEACPAP